MNFWDHISTTVIAFSCSGLSDTSKIIITWMIVPTILEGRFSELKHKVWFSSQFCTNYPEIAAVLDERLQVIKKGAVFLFVEWCVYWSLIIHYIILFVAFLPEFSHDGWQIMKLRNQLFSHFKILYIITLRILLIFSNSIGRYWYFSTVYSIIQSIIYAACILIT